MIHDDEQTRLAWPPPVLIPDELRTGEAVARLQMGEGLHQLRPLRVALLRGHFHRAQPAHFFFLARDLQGFGARLAAFGHDLLADALGRVAAVADEATALLLLDDEGR